MDSYTPERLDEKFFNVMVNELKEYSDNPKQQTALGAKLARRLNITILLLKAMYHYIYEVAPSVATIVLENTMSTVKEAMSTKEEETNE